MTDSYDPMVDVRVFLAGKRVCNLVPAITI